MHPWHRRYAGLAGLLLSFAACDQGDGGAVRGARANVPLVPDTLCADSTQAMQLCSVIPHEVRVHLSFDYKAVDSVSQPRFDAFSWQSFVALNWPADSAGNPLPVQIGDSAAALRVWERYADAATLFWGDTVGAACGGSAGGRPFLVQMAKNGDVVDPHASFDEAVGGPLLDRNLNFVLFQKKVNPDEEGYLTSAGLLTVAGQQAAKEIRFPAGTADSVGAIELKAAWRILLPEAGDDTTRYYHHPAVIYVPASQSATHRAQCVNAIVGLVGLHILHKTSVFPQWIWSTFEHEDNAPTCVGSAPCPGDDRRYSFFNPACTTACAGKVNNPLRDTAFVNDSTFYWAAAPPYGKAYAIDSTYGSQIVRTQAVYVPTDSVNAYWRKQLGSSVWSHYRLIGSQWMAISQSHPPDTVALPALLGNSSLESYIPGWSSCLGCHAFATTAAQNPSKPADFSFLLKMAGQPATALPRFFLERQAAAGTAIDTAPRAPTAPAQPRPRADTAKGTGPRR